MRVIHVTVEMGVGGAEMMLLKLMLALDRTRFEPTVISLTDGGPIADRIRSLDIPVHQLGMKTPWHTPSTAFKLHRLARELKGDAIQGWMYHGNIAAAMLARWSPGTPRLFWNIRHSLADLGREKILTQGLIRLGARWSDQPLQVVHNSSVSIDQHTRQGYAPHNAVMIPNGFDLAAFCPNENSRITLRDRLQVPVGTRLVGTLGRHHPMKAQGDFIRAAADLAGRNSEAHFVLAGQDIVPGNRELAQLAAACGLAGRIHLIGPQEDPAGYLAGLDVFCLSSTYGEGFPNVLGEAMSCAVPCVTTDVGEARIIVGQWGEVVPAANPPAMAAGIERLLHLKDEARHELGQACRESIQARYEMSNIADRYAEMYATSAGLDLPAR